MSTATGDPDRPRIAVDWFAARSGMDGFVHYAERLVRALSAAGERVAVLGPDDENWSTDTVGAHAPVRRVRHAPAGSRTESTAGWYDAELPRALAEHPADVVFAPAFFTPRPARTPVVVTVHDLSFERVPDAFSEANLDLYIGRGRPDAENADAVLAVSQSAADDAVRIWGLDPARVVVTPLGPTVEVRGDRVAGAAARSVGIEGGFLLCVSPGHRRKNLDRVVREYLTLPAPLRRTLPLLLVNADNPFTLERLAAAEVGGIEIDDTVRITGRLDDAVLDGLYADATALLHGSSLEGFGFPALDAMASGTPVIANDAPAINDVARGAGVFVDVFESGAMAAAIERVVTDAAYRSTLEAAGRRRASRFDWAATASRTAATLRDAAAGRLPTLSLAAGVSPAAADLAEVGAAGADDATERTARPAPSPTGRDA